MRFLVVTGCLLTTVLCSQAADSTRPNFNGRWQLESDPKVVLEIEQKNNDIRIVRASTDGAKTEITCTITGKQCDGLSAGDPCKVSYWFSGAQLVEMLLAGKDAERVLKTTRSISEDGKKLTAEILYITPQKEAEKLTFQRKVE